MLTAALFLATVAFAQDATDADPFGGESDLSLPGAPDAPDRIVGGSEETGYPSTVGLGAANFTACTGSLITPKIILTAAHCGDGIPLDAVLQFGSAYFGNTPATAEYTIGFEDLQIHPEYRELGTNGPNDTGVNDVSVLILDDEAPVTPVWFRTEPLGPEQEGELVTSVGYGITSAADQNSGGTKRSAVLVVSDIDDTFVISDSVDNDNQANICSGDSGGPQYHEEADGRLLQWAVHSWGDQNCTITSGSTRTDVVGPWILAQVEAVHGTSDVCAVNGHYGDGVCDEFCDSVDEDCIIDDYADEGTKACGCRTSTSPTGGLGLLVALALLARRRRDA